MKLGTVASTKFRDSFHKLMNQPRVPVKTAFKMRSIAKVINENLAHYSEIKDRAAKEFALKDETGKPVEEIVGTQMTTRLDMVQMPAFFKKIKELDSVEVKLDQLSVSELGDEKHLTLTPDDYFVLEFLVE